MNSVLAYMLTIPACIIKGREVMHKYSFAKSKIDSVTVQQSHLLNCLNAAATMWSNSLHTPFLAQ